MKRSEATREVVQTCLSYLDFEIDFLRKVVATEDRIRSLLVTGRAVDSRRALQLKTEMVTLAEQTASLRELQRSEMARQFGTDARTVTVTEACQDADEAVRQRMNRKKKLVAQLVEQARQAQATNVGLMQLSVRLTEQTAGRMASYSKPGVLYRPDGQAYRPVSDGTLERTC